MEGSAPSAVVPRMLQADFIDRRWRHPALLPLFFLALALLLRSFSFVAAVIDTDEGLYMLQAREWLDGLRQKADL